MIWIVLTTLSIPTSFINIFGSSYSNLPLSWYNISFLLYFITRLMQRRNFFSFNFKLSILLYVWLLIGIFVSYDKSAAIKDFLNFLPFLLYYSETGLYKQTKQSPKMQLHEVYIISTLSSAITLIIQVLIFLLFGKIFIYPNRLAFAALFSDFSFLSLFLASGAAVAIFEKKYHFLAVPLLITSAISSAKTGIIAFILALIIFLITNASIKTFLKGFLVVPVLFLALTTLTLVRQENFLESSERIESIKKSIIIILKNPLFGVGLGTESFKAAFDTRIPHNIIIQQLVQIGLPGTLLFVLILMDCLVLSLKQRKDRPGIVFTFLTILMGSMFIPDIVNSRFLPIVILLIKN